ncbi:hypothetical protein JNW90_29355 [Micromonospora sp. STR1s_5]|nr:hypothetical protein [Micromonospora sp. STR1s_5]
MTLTGLLRRPAADVECKHHYHPTRTGWACCWCPGTVGHRHDRPEQQRTECATPDAAADTDSPAAWLAGAPARSITVVPRQYGEHARRQRQTTTRS